MMGLVVKVSHQLAAGWCVAAAPTYTQLLIFCRKFSVTKVRERQLLINTGWTLLSCSLAFL